MKSAIIDVGGGLRGIYAAGIMDYCMEEKIHFDVGIGVSAGSANIASYTAGQKGRNYLFYTEYSSRKEYMSFGNLVHNGSYIDMDYIYGSLSNKDGEILLIIQLSPPTRQNLSLLRLMHLTGTPDTLIKVIWLRITTIL